MGRVRFLALVRPPFGIPGSNAGMPPTLALLMLQPGNWLSPTGQWLGVMQFACQIGSPTFVAAVWLILWCPGLQSQVRRLWPCTAIALPGPTQGCGTSLPSAALSWQQPIPCTGNFYYVYCFGLPQPNDQVWSILPDVFVCRVCDIYFHHL